MQKIGIIAEYNPFHHGHIYHLEKIKEKYKERTIVLVLSGNFTQRGIPSMINKWEKTRIALEYGVDLVIELPFPFAVQSADTFARGAVEILKEMEVDILVFGSEENDKEKLIRLAKIQLESTYQDLVQTYIKEGVNYPTALNQALQFFSKEKVDTPNDLLGLSYMKEILIQQANIQIETIKRTNSYHEEKLNEEISSATSIRLALANKENIEKQVPKETLDALEKQKFFAEDYFPLLTYKIYSSTNLAEYLSVEEGLENKIKKEIDAASSLDELIQKTKSKRYTYNYMARMYNHILTDFKKETAISFQHVPYLRILGFTQKGKQLLNSRKGKTSIPIYTTFQKQEPGFQLEKKVTSIYASILNPKERLEIIKKEYQTSPIQKEV